LDRNAALDLLKVFMAFAVVGIHTGFLKEYSADISYIFTQGIFRLAVPIFFMINGYYFYSFLLKKKSLFLWLKHLFIIYFSWSLIYIILFGAENNIIITFVYGWGHLWYIPATMEAGILLYFLRNIGDKYKVILIVITYSICIFMYYSVNYHLFNSNILNELINKTTIKRNFLFVGFPMFSIGYLIAKYNIQDRYSAQNILLFCFFAFLLLILEGIMNLIYSDKTNAFEFLLALLFIAPALFVLVLKSSWIAKNRTMSDVATITYFIHKIFIAFAAYLGIKGGTSVMFFVIGLSLLSSLVLIPLNKKVKIFL
jgi:surface polysaccharide O-acyltransferase-like enzyme